MYYIFTVIRILFICFGNRDMVLWYIYLYQFCVYILIYYDHHFYLPTDTDNLSGRWTELDREACGPRFNVRFWQNHTGKVAKSGLKTWIKSCSHSYKYLLWPLIKPGTSCCSQVLLLLGYPESNNTKYTKIPT